jgi:hypothetical protein
MNSQTSRKIIVASAMAAVVGIGVAAFSLRSHPIASAAQTPHPPAPATQSPTADPTPAAQTAVASPAAAQIPDGPAAVAEAPEVPTRVAQNDGASTKRTDTTTPSAVESKHAHHQHLAMAGTSAVTTNGTVTGTAPTADTGEKPAAETVANDGRVKSADELTPLPATSSSSVDDQKVGTSTEFAASDSQPATDVKSESAGDSLSKDDNSGATKTVPR